MFVWEMRGLPRALGQAEVGVAGAPPVIVIPGLWATDNTTWALRRFLTKSGYAVEGWGLGRNLAGRGWSGHISDLSEGWAKDDRNRVDNGESAVPAMCDRMGEIVKRRSEALGRPIALIGWSLGGMLAREAARDYPDHVSMVITLGTPVVGGPKHTIVNGRYRRSGMDVDWVLKQTIARHDVPIQCPVISIYSKQDAIVHWSASIDRWTPQAVHHEVNCTHTGYLFHAPILQLIKSELDKNLG